MSRQIGQQKRAALKEFFQINSDGEYTIKELAELLPMSINSLRQHLFELVRQNYLEEENKLPANPKKTDRQRYFYRLKKC